MTITDLKKYILKNDKIEFILEAIKCNNITFHSTKNYYTCSNYDGDNTNAITVWCNEMISVKNYTRDLSDIDACSDIITLIRYNLKLDFISAIKWIHNQLDLKYELSFKKPDEKINPLSIFEKHKQCNAEKDIELAVLNEDILAEYIPLLHIDWLREGITPMIAQRFGIGYSLRSNRVIIPLRYWLDGSLLGINARTMVKNYDLFGIKKYFITPSYPKSYNLFGLWENYKDIQQQGYVVIYESEKSVLKRCSLFDNSGVALSGHTLSQEQIRILTGLNVEIIIALDKDIQQNEVRYLCEQFYHIRKVSYIYDKWDILTEKQSPADACRKVYDFLFKHKIQYDESEHKQYLQSIKE